jgi:Putative methyltransferase
VMRRRVQAEMDQLVDHAGFEKLEQRIDEWGIFSVSIARRRQ